MRIGRWCRISGDAPDLGLPPTPPGTRFLIDNDPARDPRLNPPRHPKEMMRRLLGREPLCPWHGSVGFTAITECWNSAILATGLGASGSMVCFGGGHNDYFGSDVHRFDLATRQWSRILDGYLAGSDDDYGAGAIYPDATYPDGSPLPPHTYDYLQYDAVGNDMLLFKGQTELGPHVQAIAIPHLLSLDELHWRHGPQHPTGIFNSGGWTTWDAGRRRLWGHSGDDGGGNGLSWYTPDGDTSSEAVGEWGPMCGNKLPGVANHNAMQIDPDRDLIVVTSHARGRLHLLDPDDPAAPLLSLRDGGPRPPISEYGALEYSASLASLVYFSAAGAPGVHLLRAPEGPGKTACLEGSWQWCRVAEDSADLDPVRDAAEASRFATHPSHIFGRFRVVDYELAVLALLVRHIDSPVYALRLC
jgi:hypothetical protein